ncbi:MAG: phytanoyl-CoA dioxygenase family protein, partial [Rhodospirillales bacterium]|nr:phytanoyl-CoA dioxygenase family protein [Rhodospirillales bacterium]
AWNWHQDYGYWYFNGNLFPDMLSVLIAIDPATEENGCLRVIRGSARMGRLDHELVGGQLTADPERVAHAVERLEVVSCEMAAGDALFLHCNALHGSTKNTSKQSRNVLLCCYNAARNDPYKDHHMPRYTPLQTLPDSAVKERGGVHAGAARRFMRPEDHPDDQASLSTPDAS